MYYLRNRYYNPEIRRFINADNFFAVQGSPETLHNRNLFAYCDHNPLTRSDADGDAWMVAAASFAAGMAASVACQMVFERKSFSEVNWMVAAASGLGTAVGFLGIGGELSGAISAGISGVSTFVSDYSENKDIGRAIKNGALDVVISIGVGQMFDGKTFLKFKRTEYAKKLKTIKDLNLKPIQFNIQYTEAKKYNNYVIRNMIGRNAASYAMGQSFSYLKNWEIKTTYVNHVHIINGKIRIYKEPLTYLVYKG